MATADYSRSQEMTEIARSSVSTEASNEGLTSATSTLIKNTQSNTSTMDLHQERPSAFAAWLSSEAKTASHGDLLAAAQARLRDLELPAEGLDHFLFSVLQQTSPLTSSLLGLILALRGDSVSVPPQVVADFVASKLEQSLQALASGKIPSMKPSLLWKLISNYHVAPELVPAPVVQRYIHALIGVPCITDGLEGQLEPGQLGPCFEEYGSVKFVSLGVRIATHFCPPGMNTTVLLRLAWDSNLRVLAEELAAKAGPDAQRHLVRLMLSQNDVRSAHGFTEKFGMQAEFPDVVSTFQVWCIRPLCPHPNAGIAHHASDNTWTA